jgi:hypothetical protein
VAFVQVAAATSQIYIRQHKPRPVMLLIQIKSAKVDPK